MQVGDIKTSAYGKRKCMEHAMCNCGRMKTNTSQVGGMVESTGWNHNGRYQLAR